MPSAEAINALADAGFAVGLITVLVGGFRGWWIYGPQHERQIEELVRDRDFWRDIALRGTGLAERAVDAVVARE